MFDTAGPGIEVDDGERRSRVFANPTEGGALLAGDDPDRLLLQWNQSDETRAPTSAS
ncbi:MAG: hypothetical protein ABEJ55_05470 [Halanaeroarchaeum sp.]